MAEMKPMKLEVEGPRPTFRPAHLLAAFMWLNFAGLVWVVLFDLIPEQVAGSTVGVMALVFFLLAMGASMVGYDRVAK